jgi:hypothetical protein
MANVSRVNGFRPILHVDGSPWNGQVTRYFASASDATAIFNGDLVKLAAVSDTQGQALLGGVNSVVGGTPGVAKFVAGTDTAAVGVAVGFMINPLNLNSPQYRVASTAMYVLVADAPDTLYEVQYNGTIAATSFNKNVNVVDGGGSTVTGFSGEQADSTTVATTATLPLKIHGAVQKVDNDITAANPKIIVMINNHQLSGGTGTAGV